MTIAEAEIAGGIKLTPHPAENYIDNRVLDYFPNKDILPKVNFVTSFNKNYENKIVDRIDKNDNITTLSGIRIGDTEKIRATYPKQITEGVGHYGGKYLMYEPQESNYQNYRLLFEIY